MNKKILIGVIVVVILVILGALLMFGNGDQTISYDDYLNVTIPSNFETTEVNGLVQECYPQNKSYVLTIIEEDNVTASEVDGQWKTMKDITSNSNISEMIGISNLTDYTVGNNKVYEMLVTNTTAIKSELEYDAKLLREVDVVVPNSDKVYGLYFLTNGTAADLYNSDIEAIINSTAVA